MVEITQKKRCNKMHLFNTVAFTADAYKSERVGSAARSLYVSYSAIFSKYKWNNLHFCFIKASWSVE